MYNQSLIKLFKVVLAILALVLVFGLGFGTAAITQKAKQTTNQTTKTIPSTTPSSAKDEALTREQIEDFLIAYYTRKDLEENRKRYKPFMTDSLYNSTVELEDKPLQQSYKGYIVDQVFESAKIYVDETNKTVLVEVRYSYVVLEEKDNRDGTTYSQDTTVTIRLSYVETADGLKVNQMDNIVLTDNLGTATGTYSDLVPASSTDASTTTSSSEQGESK
ncbi:hypothetical protein K6V33_10300 [Streptococcus suis]|nr:hypothetical protein [Streptococcus suis]